MNIEGEKIVLRALDARDTQFLYDLINDPETEKMLGGSSLPVSLEQQKNWIASQAGRVDVVRCVVADRENLEEGLGTVILSDIDRKNGVAQIHIKMERTRGRGKGYGTDALRTIVQYAFKEMRLNCIYAEVLCYNEPSQKLFQKCGFKRDGLLRSRVYKGGEYVDVISYSILKKEMD